MKNWLTAKLLSQHPRKVEKYFFHDFLRVSEFLPIFEVARTGVKLATILFASFDAFAQKRQWNAT